ncbi:MAG: serine/threonine-protein kinase [Sandaracinaceae bacterium]
MATGDELLGKQLGAYRVESRLGSGATGVVYRAQGPAGSRPVALKVLHDNLGSISGLQRRFEREARVLKKLAHPAIVEITDFGTEGRYTFIAMELLVGRTLEEHLQEHPIAPRAALSALDPVLEGLAFAHDRDIVHRDLKPANVFLLRDGSIKLLDFGLAKMLSMDPDEESEEGALTRKGRIVGTPAYMAPEQITGVSLDVRADVYAMGVLLYELLADRRPFVYDRRSELLKAHLLEPVPPIMAARPGLWVCDELAALIDGALTKDPAERFPHARAMLRALRSLPEEAVSLGATATRLAQRRRQGAASAVISESERKAITESAAQSGSDPILHLGLAQVADLAGTVSTEPEPGGFPRPLPDGIAPSLVSGRGHRDLPTLRTRPASDSGVGGVPTAILYLMAVALLALSAILWMTLLVPATG